MPLGFTRLVRAAMVGLVFAAVRAAAADAAGGNWETGPQLVQRLAQPVTLSWTNAPAVRALARLGETQQIAILLDRRIDPQQEITLAASDMPLGDLLDQTARQLGAGYCQFGPVAYIGPVATARKLRTLAALRLADVKRLGPERTRVLLQLRGLRWDDLAEPRHLIAALADEAGVELLGDERIPHDLWRGADLPPLSWIDRLTLLAAEFDLAFELDENGTRVRLAPMPERVAIARQYRIGGDAESLAARWADEVPEARVTAQAGEIRVEGLLEDHERIERRFRSTPTRRTTVTPGKDVYQFAVENAALDQVVAQLAQRLNLEVQWDRAAIDKTAAAIDQLISVRVKDATLDELLSAVFEGTGLTFERRDLNVSIFPTGGKNGSP